MTATLVDHDVRERIRADLDTTMIVEAAAGTGKTTALVDRMVNALMTGTARLDRIVAVTFTELAAGELKLRLRTEIERARGADGIDGAARKHLTDALPQLEEARIGTIHSFCSELLRERPVEAEVDPLFEVAPDDVARELFGRAFDRWFERQLEQPGESVRRVLRRRVRDDSGPRTLLSDAAWALAEWRDFTTPWQRTPFERSGAIAALLDEMEALGAHAAAGDPDDYFTKSLASIALFAAEVRRREAIRGGRDDDGCEAELIGFARERHWGWTGSQRSYGGFPKAELRARRDRLFEALHDFIDRAGADLAPGLREELWPVLERYADRKAGAGRLDFLDLLLKTRDLMRGNAAVRRELQERFTHLFIDEFQDTDPLQAEILLLLAADDPTEADWRRARPVPGKLFVVGDPKQSIYRFRRADVALYEAIKRHLIAAGARVEHLTASFRAVPDVQEAVNAAFAPRMPPGSSSQAAYVPLAPVRSAVPGQPAVVALPVPAPYGDWGKIFNWRIDLSLPDAVAAFVEWLVQQSGWTVSERGAPNVRVPLEARHVCILFRRFRSFNREVTRDYVRALEARHLPHVLVGGSSFHEREEVEAIRNALAAIERPEDDLAVFATLRGPLFALGDAALLAFRSRFATLHPFRRLPSDLPPALAEVAEALAVLRDLHRTRNRRPVADTIARLLGATRAHAGFAIWPTGEQALANVTRLMDLARRAERGGLLSFRAFVERLLAEGERSEASDAPILEEGTGGVRLMTVHRAKGLEFPVVILADPTCREIGANPSRHVDAERGLCAIRLAGAAPPELLAQRAAEEEREREEAARVLYVAATRARDLLVVPVVGDTRHDGWLAALAPSLYPDDARRRAPETVQPPGCPTFGGDSVAARPARAPGPEQSVAPGLHRPQAGAHRVVWWDPNVLNLNVEETVGLRQQKLLQADESGTRSEQGIAAHAAWQRVRAEVRAAGQHPSIEVVTMTEWAGRADAADQTNLVRIEAVEGVGTRPHGKRFGTLVHAVLAAIDLDAGRVDVECVAALQARLLGAPDEERAAAVEATLAALAHPLLRRAAQAARAGACRRETPVALRLDGGTLIEGVVDVAFRDGAANAWTVVDFKTDVEIGERLTEYQTQVQLYARAVARATGATVEAILLRV